MQIEIKGVKPIKNSLESWASENGRFKNVEFKNEGVTEFFSQKGNRYFNFNKTAFVLPAQLVWLQQLNPGAKIVKMVEQTTGKDKKGTGLFDILEIYEDGKLRLKLDAESALSLVG